MAALTNKVLITVEYTITGDDNFIRLLADIIEEKKTLTPTADRSIWDYNPEEKVISALVTG